MGCRTTISLLLLVVVTITITGFAHASGVERDLRRLEAGAAKLLSAPTLEIPGEDAAPARAPRVGSRALPLRFPDYDLLRSVAPGAVPETNFDRFAALAAGDLDEDGTVDLVVGRALGKRGSLAVYRGNRDAIYSIGKRGDRPTPAPFHDSERVFELATVPSFLGIGDFDNDGHPDVVAGTIGETSLVVLLGDGRGGLRSSMRMPLPGRLTVLATGEVNRRDGLVDIVAGIDRVSEEPAVVIHESPAGALFAEAEIIALPSSPNELAFVRPDGSSFVGIVAATGSNVVFVHGRDRRLTSGRSRRAEVPPIDVELLDFPGAVASLAWGDFLWEPVPAGELAVLTDDGALHFVGYDAGQRERGRRNWHVLGSGATIAGPGGPVDPGGRPKLALMRARGRPTVDLALLDSSSGRLLALSVPTREAVSDPNVDAVEGIDLGGSVTALLPMRLNRDAVDDLVFLTEGAPEPQAAITSPASVMTVNSAADNLTAGDGLCTLREAIRNANGNADLSSGDCPAGSGIDAIEFSIGGGGATATITPTSPLPALSDTVLIDGTTQGCASPPCIELNGSLAGAGAVGLQLAADGSAIRGLVINRFQSHGILCLSSGNIIEGNFIGTDLTGTVDQGNGASCASGCGAGIRFEGSASNNTIGGTVEAARNVISGNSSAGIFLLLTGPDNVVVGNHIGADLSGTLAVGNHDYGIRVAGAANTRVGGALPGEGNLVSGNLFSGIFIARDQGDLIQVSGNRIGTDVTGTAAVPNEQRGIYLLHGDDNTIGGSAVGAGNLISGNLWAGVVIQTNDPSMAATGNLIAGNRIGTDLSGTADLGNEGIGIRIDASPDNVVGGTAESARNLISGNESDGIFVSGIGADRNEILGNYVGTDVNGTAAIPNLLVGVEIQDAADNVVGGGEPGAGNLISGNGTTGDPIDDSGVLLEEGSATGTRILGNRIGTDVTGTLDLGNGGVGITLLGANGTFIGGDGDGEGNLISGNGSDGVFITCRVPAQGEPCAGGAGNSVRGNLVGTDATGSVAIPNDLVGVEVDFADTATGNVIGGPTPESRNVISGNVDAGILLQGPQNFVAGNFIGTDATGTFGVGNGAQGVQIEDGSGNTVGGDTVAERNVISGNGEAGILIEQFEGNSASGNRIAGNYVGTDVGGTSSIGNGGRGVEILGGSGNEVENNTIAFNVAEGVGVVPATTPPLGGPAVSNAVLGNAIHSNGLLGIDLASAQPGSDGMTANDSGDNDSGGNGLQNFPALTLADATPTPDVTLEGSLDSTRNTNFRIEFFENIDCDGSTHGEGRRYLGFTNVATPGAGVVNFSAVLTAAVSDGAAVTATATDEANNTSEFSACFEISCGSTVVFPGTLLAPDREHLTWANPADVYFAKGDLGSVSSYAAFEHGTSFGASSLGIADEAPGPGDGVYYVMRPLGCGSWQSVPAAEPGRDGALP